MTREAENYTAFVLEGTEAYFFDTLDSTNTKAALMARNGHKGPLWIAARAQTGGRGRNGRIWTSKPGNFYGSYLFSPDIDVSGMAVLPYLVALAIRDSLIEAGLAPDQVQCKWPNDILVHEHKIAGVLIETSLKPDARMEYIVIGVGVNLSHHPDDTLFPATHLKAQGINFSLETYLSLLSRQVHKRLLRLKNADHTAVYQEWSSCAWGLGTSRTIKTAKASYTGKLMGLSDDGGLRVLQDDGTEKQLYAGDVFPLSKQSEHSEHS